MRQVFLKASYGLGWASSNYRAGLGGQGATPFFDTFGSDSAKCVVPIDGKFNNLQVYSPAGLHPNYTVTLMVNGVATALVASLAASATLASDKAHVVNVVAGDDIYFSVNVNPFGSGVGYPMNLSIEFEGAQQFYSVMPNAGGHSVGSYNTGGCLGNGIQQVLSATNQLSNTYSICTTPGVITGIRTKGYSVLNVGGSFVAYIIKNLVLQDGTGGTVNTACTLIDGVVTAVSTFSLPVVTGDRLDFALRRDTTAPPFSLAQVAISCTFTPTDPNTFMNCGGNNDANVGGNGFDWKWVQSEQLGGGTPLEALAQCPVGPTGIIVTGLLIEGIPQPDSATPGVQSRVFTIRKNGVDTGATVTVSELQTSGLITGLNIPFSDGDLIDLQIQNINNPITLNGMKWGLTMKVYRDRSGLYEIKPGTRDKYYGDVEKKIPDPTIKTALIGE